MRGRRLIVPGHRRGRPAVRLAPARPLLAEGPVARAPLRRVRIADHPEPRGPSPPRVVELRPRQHRQSTPADRERRAGTAEEVIGRLSRPAANTCTSNHSTHPARHRPAPTRRAPRSAAQPQTSPRTEENRRHHPVLPRPYDTPAPTEPLWEQPTHSARHERISGAGVARRAGRIGDRRSRKLRSIAAQSSQPPGPGVKS